MSSVQSSHLLDKQESCPLPFSLDFCRDDSLQMFTSNVYRSILNRSTLYFLFYFISEQFIVVLGGLVILEVTSSLF